MILILLTEKKFLYIIEIYHNWSWNQSAETLCAYFFNMSTCIAADRRERPDDDLHVSGGDAMEDISDSS